MPSESDAYSRRNLDNGRQGWVYVLTNPSMPSLLKIGATRKHPLQRAKELGAATGVPTPFSIAYYRDFSDCFLAETLVHEEFAGCRTEDSREFFDSPLAEVVDYIDSLGARSEYRDLCTQDLTGGECQVQFARKPAKIPATPWAELFASFPDDGSARELTPAERAQCAQLRNSLS